MKMNNNTLEIFDESDGCTCGSVLPLALLVNDSFGYVDNHMYVFPSPASPQKHMNVAAGLWSGEYPLVSGGLSQHK